MRGDIPAAALRLATVLPVRTHHAPDLVPKSTASMRRRKALGSGGANSQPVRVRGVEYDSIRDACRTLKCSPKTIMVWLASGAAEYLQMALE